MKRTILRTAICTAFALFASLSLYAGDAAVFQDIGFSDDGTTYIFGQYGKTDKNYEAWAEIYTVDVAKNDYVKGEIFTTEPSAETANLSGKKAYELLKEKAEWKTAKYNCKPCDVETLLYIRSDEAKNAEQEIVFKDFEGSTENLSVYFHIKLCPYYEGSGKNVRSSYYILLEKQDADGNLLFKKVVGNPDIKRKGISSYKINRIYTDKSAKSLVFIIEKTYEDDTGTSIRYMVETLRF